MQHLARVVRAGVVAVVAACASAELAAQAAAGGAATPRWVFLLAGGASLICAVAVNIATALLDPVERNGGGDVSELVRAARSGAHHRSPPATAYRPAPRAVGTRMQVRDR